MKDLAKFRIGTVVVPYGTSMEIGRVIGFSKKWERVSPNSTNLAMHMKFYVVVQWATDQIYGSESVDYDIRIEDPNDLEVLQ